MSIRGSTYIRKGFDKEHIKKVISSFRKAITDNVFGEFDGIVCRGTSGLLIAPLLAYEFNKKLLVSRKLGDNSHASAIIEGAADIQKFVIVDDFVSTGNTIWAILESFQEEKNRYNYYAYNAGFYEPVFVGCYLWSESHEKGRAGKQTIANNLALPLEQAKYNKLLKDKIYVQYHNSRKRYTVDTYKYKRVEELLSQVM